MNPSSNDVEISRLLAAPRARIWQAWSDPKLLARWWCPKPWTTEVRKFEFRAGGDFHTFMRGPDGKGGEGESDNPGCFLDIEPMERIVCTSMLTGGWRPTTPWIGMTAILNLSDEGAGTRYHVRCLHRDEAERKKHEDMGFFEGWGSCINQLEELAKTL